MLNIKQLQDKYNLQISGIIHIGAHKAQEIEEYTELGVSNFVFFEPIKDIFIELNNNLTKYINYDIVTHNTAIGSKSGTAILNISTNDKMSSSILKPELHLLQYPDIKFDSVEEVYINTLDSYNYTTKYNFLNIDVQGYELEVLYGAKNTLEYIDYIYCEVNREQLYQNNAFVEQIDDFLLKFNFKRVETDWFCGTWGEALYIKEKLDEKKFIWGDLPELDIITIQREIFQEKVYDTIKSVESNNIVMDIGASVGPFIYSIIDKNPKKIYAIEPSKKLLEVCKKNIKTNSEIIYINKAISDNIDKVNIFGGDIDYETISFKNLIEQYKIDHIDFLKIDCEGGEYSIFTDENLSYLKNNIDFIAMEIHLSYPGFREKFKYFRDNYLIHFPHYDIRSCTTQNIDHGNSIDLKPYIWNNEFIDNYCCEIMIYIDNTIKNNLFTKFALDTENPEINFDLAYYYHSIGHTASAFSHYLRCAERTDSDNLAYECFLRGYYCYDSQQDREFTAKHLLKQAISLLPKRPEAYYLLCKFYSDRKEWYETYMLASIALAVCDFDSKPLKTFIGYNDKYNLIYEKAISAWWWDKVNECKYLLNTILEDKKNLLDVNTMNHINETIINIEKQQQTHTLYNKSDYINFKHIFKNLEDIEHNYSQCYQDMFVLCMTNGKLNGSYLEIGAGDPYVGNNTALLESKFGWNGISIEIDKHKVKTFKEHRKNTIICTDATIADYSNLLGSLNCGFNIDYLQLDCEPPQITYETLLKIPFNQYKFAVITYEHDYCVDSTKSYRDKSRDYLKSLGYELIVTNIAANENSPFEDWWAHPDLIDKTIISKMKDLSNETKQAKKYMLSIN